MVLALQLKADGFKNKSIQEASRESRAVGSGVNLHPSAALVLRNVRLLPTMEDTGIALSFALQRLPIDHTKENEWKWVLSRQAT